MCSTDSIHRHAAPGDVLYLTRTDCGGFGLSILRGGGLVLALGAVCSVQLGESISVGPRRGSPFGVAEGSSKQPGGMEVRTDSGSFRVAERETKEVDGFNIYVEAAWTVGIPGTDECMAISTAETIEQWTSAMRDAIPWTVWIPVTAYALFAVGSARAYLTSTARVMAVGLTKPGDA